MTMTTFFPALARCVLTSALFLPSSAALSASAPEGTEPAVEPQDAEKLASLVIVYAEMEGGDEVAAVLRAEILAALHDARVDPTLPEQAPLEVFVSPDPEVVGSYDVVYRHRGDAHESWSCQCSGEELRTRLAHDAVDVWNTISAASPPAPSVPVSAAAAEPVHLDTHPAAAQRRPGRALWVAGVTTTAFGTAVVVGTTALLLSDLAVDFDHSPTTLGLLGGGIATVASGVALWATGAHRRNHGRLSIVPTMRNRGVAFAIRGSF